MKSPRLSHSCHLQYTFHDLTFCEVILFCRTFKHFTAGAFMSWDKSCRLNVLGHIWSSKHNSGQQWKNGEKRKVIRWGESEKYETSFLFLLTKVCRNRWPKKVAFKIFSSSDLERDAKNENGFGITFFMHDFLSIRRVKCRVKEIQSPCFCFEFCSQSSFEKHPSSLLRDSAQKIHSKVKMP